MPDIFIGVDISKAYLDLYRSDLDRHWRIAARYHSPAQRRDGFNPVAPAKAGARAATVGRVKIVAITEHRCLPQPPLEEVPAFAGTHG